MIVLLTGRKQALFGLMAPDVVLDACSSGQWDDAAVSFLTKARAVFAEYAAAFAANSEAEEASVWATFDALVGPMRQVVNDALSGQIDPHQAHTQLGRALDAVVSHQGKFPNDIASHKMKLSRACRDVLVVQCIRVAGTYTDQPGFHNALATAVGRVLGKDDVMYAQMHQAYATLLLGTPDFEYKNGHKKRPGRPPQENQGERGPGEEQQPTSSGRMAEQQCDEGAEHQRASQQRGQQQVPAGRLPRAPRAHPGRHGGGQRDQLRQWGPTSACAFGALSARFTPARARQ